jgi:sirohydrochlorin ferrochelatase
MTVLIGCAHGTREPAGQQIVLDLLDSVRDALGVSVRAAYVDVQEPHVAAVVAEVVAGGQQAVVVPLLLAGGYHVYVDIAQAVAGHAHVAAAPALGPDRRLIDIVIDRASDAGVPRDATIILAAAGSSDSRSQADTEAAAEMLRARWRGPVRVGYAAGIAPSVADAVASARANGEDEVVAVASFLLAPGTFQSRLEESGADFVTAPLAPDPRLIEIIADRFRDAQGTLGVG